MNRDVALYVADVLANMDKAVQFVGAMTCELFKADQKTAYAVVRCFEIIGEAVKNVPESVRSRRQDVPWKGMAGMRDRCIHAYFGTDYDAVWVAVKSEVPQIRPSIQSLLDELRRESAA
jgi:uncharacterized protein with HEPN domain